METKKTTTSVWSRITGSVTFKALSIGILILLMLIPVNMIQDLITERETASKQVMSEISSKWGEKQQIMGPIIMVPYSYQITEQGKIKEEHDYAYFLPEDLHIKTGLEPEMRYRSIYKTVVYQSDIKLSGLFKHPDFSQINRNISSVDWAHASALIGISDIRGVRNKLSFVWNGQKKEVTPGIEASVFDNAGVTVKLPLSETPNPNGYTFEFDLKLNGSENLSFIPVGETTSVTMQSSWPTPSFDGAFLPDQRHISEKGFSASWNIYHYNRNFSQVWTAYPSEISASGFGISLLLPIDQYQKSMRSVKYALMFIVLTFVVFFLVELISRKKIHPFQYLLVSAGLILFYSLLLALSEQMNFNLAYLLSSGAIIGLITAYSYAIFKNIKQTLFMGIFLIALYVFLYVVLQLEDMALLIGSLGLFVALAIVMFVSRKINWYNSGQQPEESNE